MLRRLLITGLFSALLLCGWGGAFAAVMCPHALARAAAAGTHACCRARMPGRAPAPEKKAAKPSPHCHAQPEQASSTRGARSAHGHESQASRASEHGDRATHSASHEAEAPLEAAHATREDRAASRLLLDERGAAWAVRPSDVCAHCVGDSKRPTAPAKARGGEGARRVESRPEPRPQRPLPIVFASFAPEVIPVQGAPPGAARRHALLGVFLI